MGGHHAALLHQPQVVLGPRYMAVLGVPLFLVPHIQVQLPRQQGYMMDLEDCCSMKHLRPLSDGSKFLFIKFPLHHKPTLTLCRANLKSIGIDISDSTSKS